MQNIVPMSRNFLELRFGQSLTLTPSLQQSIRLLQLSTHELEAEVAKALADNPLLEQDAEGEREPAGDNQEELAAPDDRAQLEFSTNSRQSSDDESIERPEAARENNLREYLLSQLGTSRLSERDAAIVALLIEELNEDGLLVSPLEEILDWMQPELGLEIEDFKLGLKYLQSLDPPGVGGRHLGECLDLQLQYADIEIFPEVRDQDVCLLARQICQRHLNILATGNLGRLRETLGCEAALLRRAHALIVKLNPRPGSRWNKPAADFAVPDVIVRKTRKGWEAQLNQAVMPKLHVNTLYAEALGSSRGGSNSALHGQLQEARWLIRHVAQRFETILRVSQVIVAHQQSFFVKGWEAVRPLTLKDIALELGMHESTISRATTQKFMVTPFGTLELKRFFSTGLATQGGEATSSTAIQSRMQVLIGQEDRTRPLSDSQLVSILGKDGITIARRTVAKYREQLRIPTAPLRKSQAGVA